MLNYPKRRRQTGLLLLAAILLPRFAQAHAILEESTPPVGGTVAAGPLDVRLRYNSRVDRSRSRLVLTRSDHSQTKIPIADGGAPNIISSHLDLPAGAYSIRWQVLAVDGHITRGDVPFTVTGP